MHGGLESSRKNLSKYNIVQCETIYRAVCGHLSIIILGQMGELWAGTPNPPHTSSFLPDVRASS